MERKTPAASTADELLGAKEEKAPVGYFSTVFPPSSAAVGKNALQSDLYSALSKQRVEAQIRNAHELAADGKSQGNLPKTQTTNSKDGKPLHVESTESPYFGSSVHYGARDFYSSSSFDHSVKNPKIYQYKEDDRDDSIASRGDWWQGSLYY